MELMKGSNFMLKMRKILVKKSFRQFLIRIQIQDSDPDSNPGFESGFGSETNFRPDPYPKPSAMYRKYLFFIVSLQTKIFIS
jgi:hypothetical protein